MSNKHPLNDSSFVEIIRHANGATVRRSYRLDRDRAEAPEDMRVFTSFNELCDFLRGWWPAEGKE